MRLSRLLYEEQEIKYSLLIALLYKTSLDETYFWASEFYFSYGYKETTKIIWEIYYDFYFCENHNMREWIIMLLNTENEYRNVLSVVKNLFQLEWNTGVFEIRKFYETNPKPSVIYRRLPSKLNIYTKKVGNVINALDKNDLPNVCAYLHYCGDKTKIRDSVINPLKNSSSTKRENLDHYTQIIQHITSKQNIVWHDASIVHIVLGEIVYNCCMREKRETNENYIIQKINSEFEKFININHKNLSLSRFYKIKSEYIGCFKLPRATLKLNKQTIYQKWELYCFNTKYWNDVFKKYNASLFNSNVTFKCQKEEENFYKNYGYDIDEYPSKSNDIYCFCEITPFTYREFIEHLTGRQPVFI